MAGHPSEPQFSFQPGKEVFLFSEVSQTGCGAQPGLFSVGRMAFIYFLQKVICFQNVFTKGLQLVMDMTETRKSVCVRANRTKEIQRCKFSGFLIKISSI